MLCNICNKNNASIHLEGIVNGKTVVLHMCEDCANKRGFDFNFAKHNFSLVDLLANLSDWEIPGHKTLKTVTCPGCGLTYTKFKETARLGCSKCYDAFTLQLTPLLKRLHGSSKHKGKKPKVTDSNKDTLIIELKHDLMKAVAGEEFEKAAEIRDRIKELKKS